AAGADISKGRNLCGGFRPFFLWQRKARLALLVGRAEGDAPDRAHRDDQLVALDAERQKPEAGLTREGSQRQPFAARELDLDMRALGGVRRRVLLDLPVDAR